MGAEPTMGFVLDGLIAVLLVVTISAGFLLNRRIETLRRTAADIQSVMGGFDRATQRAQAGVEALKTAAKDAGRQLQDQINAARGLREELKRRGRVPVTPDGRVDARAEAKADALARSMLSKHIGKPAAASAGQYAAQTATKTVTKPAARPAMRPGAAVNASTTDSEVERELRELLRHVR